jgi:hypothetical protein
VKNSLGFATSLVLAAGALLASGSIAHAGEGASAGSVGVKFNNALSEIKVGEATIKAPTVRSISSSVAVGKNAAAATARTSRTDGAYSSAIGNGGELDVTNADNINVGYETKVEANVGKEQKNTLTNPANLGPTGIVLP